MQLEKASSNQKAEIAKLKDRNAKIDRELTKALDDLKAREWDVKQLLSKQDKTIVEHVHVLEEAKRVTDRLLQEAQLELRRNENFIRSLQSAKTKMASEAEDMAVKNERELRTKEKEVKMQQEKVTRALVGVEKERKGKEDAELQILRLQYELQQVQNHAKDVEGQLLAVQQSKSTLENEVDRLAGEGSGVSLANLQRQYESYDERQLQYDDEVFNNGGWKKEKERLKTKIADLEKAYEASTGAQTEQQTQILALHSQVRELRGVLDDAEADRTLLQKARRALQGELETIKLDQVPDTNKITSDHEFQKLQLKNQDLERSLEEQEDRVSNAFDRMKKAESFAYQCQIELGKVRVENSELDKLNVCLQVPNCKNF
jgi:myosin protein heavy chain